MPRSRLKAVKGTHFSKQIKMVQAFFSSPSSAETRKFRGDMGRPGQVWCRCSELLTECSRLWGFWEYGPWQANKTTADVMAIIIVHRYTIIIYHPSKTQVYPLYKYHICTDASWYVHPFSIYKPVLYKGNSFTRYAFCRCSPSGLGWPGKDK